MREVPVAAAFTSDLTRTRTTASAALIGHPNVPAVAMHDLREWHFGSWEGQPNASLWTPVFSDHGYSYVPASPDWPMMTADGYDSVLDAVHRHDPSGRAEAAEDVRLRLTRGLKVVVAAAEQAARTGEGDVLVVTHGAVLGGMLRHIAPTHLLPAGFPNCGILTVAWREGKGDVAVGEIDAFCALREMAISAG
jgi:probable phosphoglycerate mutase